MFSLLAAGAIAFQPLMMAERREEAAAAAVQPRIPKQR
jgi:hypothetical protein